MVSKKFSSPYCHNIVLMPIQKINSQNNTQKITSYFLSKSFKFPLRITNLWKIFSYTQQQQSILLDVWRIYVSYGQDSFTHDTKSSSPHSQELIERRKETEIFFFAYKYFFGQDYLTKNFILSFCVENSTTRHVARKEV